MKGYKPLGDTIVARLSGEIEKATDGGIIIPVDTASNFSEMAHEVVAVSDKVKTAIDVKVGDYVTFRNDCRYKDLQIDGEHFIQIDSFHVLGITDKEHYPTNINDILSREVKKPKIRT